MTIEFHHGLIWVNQIYGSSSQQPRPVTTLGMYDFVMGIDKFKRDNKFEVFSFSHCRNKEQFQNFGRSLYECHAHFLQRGRIACNAERCNTYSNSVCPSVRLSHAGTLSRRMNIGLRSLHCELAKTL